MENSDLKDLQWSIDIICEKLKCRCTLLITSDDGDIFKLEAIPHAILRPDGCLLN